MSETSRGTAQPTGDAGTPRIPASTYRLQLNAQFRFSDALELTGYLHQLGITHCYASPIFSARPDSSHGYDVCDANELNPNIGSREDFERWSERLRMLGMGLLLDIVPNHMAADPRNPWWRDVLQHGTNSRFANWFDIRWPPANKGGLDRVILPLLEDHYWKILESGKLQVLLEQGEFRVAYHEHRLPLSPDSISLLEREILQEITQAAEPLDILDALRKFLHETALNTRTGPHSNAAPPSATPAMEALLDRALKRINGSVGEPRSFDVLHALLQRQHYQLAYWRNGNEELNYRRFFDINELVALRMELPAVFEATHALILSLLHTGKVTGVRVDHPDGLRDPKQYFRRLQSAFADTTVSSQPGPDTEPGGVPGSAQLYIVVEKILSFGEALPSHWPVAGTTGYDFLNLLNGLFINGGNRAVVDEAYRQFTGLGQEFRSLVYEAKLKILHTSLLADFHALGLQLRGIAAKTRYGLDFSATQLNEALAAIVAAFPVYRTYITEESQAPTPEERRQIHDAIEFARLAPKPPDPEALSFVESLLLLRFPPDLNESTRLDCRRFVMNFQQLTGPAMAKGLEDTTFYRFNRFISLNEVGGAPDQFGTGLERFHQQNRLRAEHWPHTLLATATHDTKRGEDLRARLNVLSEMPEEWRQAVLKWRGLNAEKKTVLEGVDAPDPNDEYFFYQVLVGAWNSEAEGGVDGGSLRQRLTDYMLKVIREAKVHTSWTEPNQAYERATQRFISEILSASRARAFLDDFMLFQRKVAFFGLLNSMAQVVLKMTIPGVPDFYQGTELWDFNLVDPDNRRSVDYHRCKTLLTELRERFSPNESDTQTLIRGLLKNYQTGQIKLYLVWRILELRNRYRLLFENGSYVSMPAAGSKSEHICSFARNFAQESVITVAARLVLGLTNGAQRGALDSDVWQDTSLPIPGAAPGARFRNVLTQHVVTVPSDSAGLAIPEVLGLLPVAVLERVPDG